MWSIFGVSKWHKRLCFLDLNKKEVFVSRNVLFYESILPFINQPTSPDKLLSTPPIVPNRTTIDNNHFSIGALPTEPNNHPPQSIPNKPNQISLQPETSKVGSPSSASSSSPESISSPAPHVQPKPHHVQPQPLLRRLIWPRRQPVNLANFHCSMLTQSS